MGLRPRLAGGLEEWSNKHWSDGVLPLRFLAASLLHHSNTPSLQFLPNSPARRQRSQAGAQRSRRFAAVLPSSVKPVPRLFPVLTF